MASTAASPQGLQRPIESTHSEEKDELSDTENSETSVFFGNTISSPQKRRMGRMERTPFSDENLGLGSRRETMLLRPRKAVEQNNNNSTVDVEFGSTNAHIEDHILSSSLLKPRNENLPSPLSAARASNLFSPSPTHPTNLQTPILPTSLSGTHLDLFGSLRSPLPAIQSANAFETSPSTATTTTVTELEAAEPVERQESESLTSEESRVEESEEEIPSVDEAVVEPAELSLVELSPEREDTFLDEEASTEEDDESDEDSEGADFYPGEVTVVIPRQESDEEQVTEESIVLDYSQEGVDEFDAEKEQTLAVEAEVDEEEMEVDYIIAVEESVSEHEVEVEEAFNEVEKEDVHVKDGIMTPTEVEFSREEIAPIQVSTLEAALNTMLPDSPAPAIDSGVSSAPLDQIATPSVSSPPSTRQPSPSSSESSSTPTAAQRARPLPINLAAPAAKRRLVKGSSLIARVPRKVEEPVMGAGKRRSGLVALPSTTAIITPVVVSTPPVSTSSISPTSAPPSTASSIAPTTLVTRKLPPPTSINVASTSRLAPAVPQPALIAPLRLKSKLVVPSKASPSQIAAPGSIRPLPFSNGTSRGLVKAGNTLTRKPPSVEMPPPRPGSAQSNSSTSSFSHGQPLRTLPRPLVVSKPSSLKIPNGTNGGRSLLARSTTNRLIPGGGGARVGDVPAPPTTKVSVRATSSSSIRPPSSSTSATALLRTGGPNPLQPVVPLLSVGARVVEPSSTTPPIPVPSSLPLSLLPPLVESTSAPLLDSSVIENHPVLPVVPALPPVPRPRPLVSRADSVNKSPLKRRALRNVDLVQTESEVALNPRIATSTNLPTALQRAVSNPILPVLSLAASLGVATRPPPFSPVKANKLPAPARVVSALIAPAEKVQSESSTSIFGEVVLPSVIAPTPSLPPLPRPKRPRTPTSVVPTPSTSDAELSNNNVANVEIALPPLPRPTRRTILQGLSDELDSAQVAVPPAVIPRPSSIITFNPPPDLTQQELSTITQKNTKKNKARVNKLEIQTIVMGVNRPPSPTSKIRKSLEKEGSLGRPTTKAGREARAAKRRSALRSSVDGTEMDQTNWEMEMEMEGVEKVPPPPLVHYRAPGDEEDYTSPVRPPRRANLRLELAEEGDAEEAKVKSVKWDKALVYEGPVDPPLKGVEYLDGIIKRKSLDEFGNVTVVTNDLVLKRSAIVVQKFIYKDDEA